MKKKVQIFNELKDMGKGIIPIEKIYFLTNVALLLCPREKVLDNFKIKVFPTKTLESEPEPEHQLAVFATPKQKKNELRNVRWNLCRF